MKYGTFLLGAVSGTLILLSSPASARSVGNDVRCLLLSNMYVKAVKDPKGKRLAEAGSLFYLGRIDGRINDGQLKTVLQEQQKAIKTANVAASMAECARHMQASARTIQTISGQLAPKK